jgi:type IV fimbrial biogenesis protein FimT
MKSRGFTLIELLVVLAIAAILAMMAAPSFKRILQSGAMSSNVNTFLTDMRFARSEAIRYGGNVVMCRSDDPEGASPVCDAGAGPGNNGWVSGWIIFHDLDADTVIDAGEQILRIQAPITNINSIVETTPNIYRFTATGRLLAVAGGGESQLSFGSSPTFDTSVRRVVCVGLSGRARVAGDGSTSCP